MQTTANHIKWFRHLTLFAVVLGFVVVMLGAWTRLSDAGLGCPDWPGCYGQLLGVPHTKHEIALAAQHFPTIPVVEPKAWPEVIHRYFAGTLGLCIVILFAWGWRLRKQISSQYSQFIPTLLLGLLIFQALLGMWTVTLKLLPLVVMGHLLGGMTITAALWKLFLEYRDNRTQSMALATHIPDGLYHLAIFATIIVFCQISLGGWTSSNYAALICPHFPFCRGSLFPAMHLAKGFNLFSSIGANYEGGLLGEKARIAIQMVHRYGAALTTITLGALAVKALRQINYAPLQRAIYCMLGILAIQFALGVLNIELLLPMPIALAHNGVGLLLLIVMVTIWHIMQRLRSQY